MSNPSPQPYFAMASPTALVSVIIPCYNQAHFLPESIESVLVQAYPHAEVVVVDDGSPDNTAEVIARYPALQCVRQQNRGVAPARNAGFASSRGEYIMFLDADDRLAPDAIESHLRCFAEHPEAGFVVGDIAQITGDGSHRESAPRPILRANHYEELLKVNHVANTIAVMFRRSVLEAVGGFKSVYTPAEDYEILLRAARSFPSAHHEAIVAHYRRHSANTSRKGAVMLRAMHLVMNSQREFVEGHLHLEAALRKGENHWRDFFGAVTIKQLWAHIRSGNLRGAVQDIAALLKYVRGRVLIIPFKFRARAFAATRLWLGFRRKPVQARKTA